MRNYYTTGEYLSGVDPNEPAEKGDTENRSWGTFAKDVAIDALARPVVSAVRTGTQAARMADESSPTLEAIDTSVGGAEAWLKKQRSPRAEALDQLSLAPGPDGRSFWNEPMAGSLHSFLPSVPYAIAGILTGGGTWAAQAGMTAAAGAFGGGEALNELRDFADTTPKDQLLQLPPFKKIMDENGGDERAARIKFFHDSIDPTSMTFNFLVNALEVPAFMRGMGRGAKGIGGVGRATDTTGRRAALGARDRLLSAAEGGVEGAVLGSAEGGTEALIQQQAAVKRGQQEQIEGGEIEKGIASGAVFAGPMAAFHAIAPPAHKATGPAGTGAAEIDTLSKQLGQPRIFPDEGMPEQVPQPGQGRDVVTPEAPLAPQFPDIGPPGRPGEGDFPSEPGELQPPPPWKPPTPEQYGPPRPTRAQQLYQRTGVYGEPAEQAATAPEATTARQPEQPFAGTRLDRLYRERDNLEAGQFRREELLTDDNDLNSYAAQMGMTPEQTREQLTRQHESGQQRLEQLRQFIATGAAHAQERNLGVPERRAALKETGITPTRTRAYRETEATGRMEGEGPPVATPEAPRAPAFPEIETPDVRGAFAQEQPVEEPGISQHQEDMIRSGAAPFSLGEREKFAQEMIDHANRSGKLMRHHIPKQLLDQMTSAERGALGSAIEVDPQRAIDIVRKPPESTLEAHPVMQELQARQRTRKREEERVAEEKRAEARRKAEAGEGVKPTEGRKPEPTLTRKGEKPTGLETALERSIDAYKVANSTTQRERYADLVRRARAIDERRRAAGLAPKDYAGQIPSPEAQERTRAAERQQMREKAYKRQETERRAKEAPAEKRRQKLLRFYTEEQAQQGRVPFDRPETLGMQWDRLVAELGDNPSIKDPKVRAIMDELRDINRYRMENLPPGKSGHMSRWAVPDLAVDRALRQSELDDNRLWSQVLREREARTLKFAGATKWVGKGKNRYRRLVGDRVVGEAERKKSAAITERLRGPETHIGKRPLKKTEFVGSLPPLTTTKHGFVPRPKAESLLERAGQTTERYVEYAKKYLTKEEINRELKIGKDFVERVKTDDWREMIIQLAEERAIEARERVAQGLPPVRMASVEQLPIEERVKRAVRGTKRTVQGYLPSVEAALAAFEQGRALEAGAKSVKRTRDPYYKARENVYQQSLQESIANRLGTDQKVRELFDKINILNKLPQPVRRRGRDQGTTSGLSLKMRLGEANAKYTPWLRDILARETATGHDPVEHTETENQNRMWLNAKREEVALAKQVKKFLEHAITKARVDMKNHKDKNKITGRGINWELASRQKRETKDQYGEITGTHYTFQSGKEDPANYVYNYMNDLQKVDEAIRRITTNLENAEREAGTMVSQRSLGPNPQTRKARKAGISRPEDRIAIASTIREEYGRYTRELDTILDDFTNNMDKFIKGDLAGISASRAQKNLVADDRFHGGSLEAMRERLLGQEGRVEAEGTVDRRGAEEAAEQDVADLGEDTKRRSVDVKMREGQGFREYEPRVAGEEIIEASGNIDPETGEVKADPLLETAAEELTGGGKTALTRGVNVIEERLSAEAFRKINKDIEDAKKAGNISEQEKRWARRREEWGGAPKATPQDLLNKVRKGGLYMEAPEASEFTDTGLPVKRLPKWKAGQSELSLTHNQQRHLAAYDRFAQPGADAMNHPLIGPRMTAADVVGHVKRMLTEGLKGHNLPSKYINPEFLDQLAQNAGDVAIYNTPVDVISSLGRRGIAFYQPETDRIALPSDAAAQVWVQTAVHELAHAVEMRMLGSDPRFAEGVHALYTKAVQYAKRQGTSIEKAPRLLYGLKNVHEFLAETQSNEDFRQWLNRVNPPEGYGVIHGIKSVMNALYKVIRDGFRRLMGAGHGDTALDVLYYDQSSVLGQTDKMIARMMEDINRNGRPAFVEPNPDANFGGDGKYYLSMAGSKAFVDHIKGAAFEKGHDLGDAARYAWKTMDKNRGLGLVMHTLYDMTQRGSRAIKEMSSRLLDIVERQNHERSRILRDIDAPKLDRLQKYLNGLNKDLRRDTQSFIVDESRHGAYADAELNSARNAHLYKRQTPEEIASGAPRVFDDSLKNEQIKLQHPEMMKELERLEREAPGFKDIRTMVHEWAREREIAMRSGRIRDFLKSVDLAYPVDKAAREQVMDVLERAVDADKIDGDRVLTRADQRVLSRTVGDVNGATVKGVLDKISQTADLDKKELMGPYTPFTRRGDFAVSGNFIIHPPEHASVLEGGINRETGEPIGNPRFVFPTAAEARAFIKEITDKYGIKLIKAGEIPIDTTTGQPPRGYDEENPDSTERVRGKALTAAIEAGAPIETRHYVQFQTKFLEFHPTERAAAKAIGEWEAHAKEKGFEMKLSQPKDVLDQEGRVNERYVGQQLENMIRTVRASDAYQNLHPSEQGAVMTSLKLASSQYTMRRGLAQRYLPRGYVEGMSTNLLETYNEWAGMTAGYLAKVKYAADLKERTDAMRDHVKATDGSKEALLDSRLYNEFMQRLHSPKVNPRDTWLNRQVERGLRWTMLDKLPSLAYFTVQMTEPAFVATPLLADHHGPVEIVGTMAGMYKLAGASRFMREGLGDIANAFKRKGERFRWDHLFGELVKNETDGDRLTKLYDVANDRNYFDAAASLDFDRAYLSSRNVVDRAADWLQAMFQSANTAIENLNRFVTIGTAYRLEFSKLTKGGMEEAAAHEQAVQYALNKAHEANGIYSSYNAPPIFGSTTLGRIVSQFKKYPQRITANYIRAMVGTVKGAGQLARGEKVSPENKERARQLAYMIATQALVAGAMGLPTEVFAVPLNTMYIAGLSPYNWDDVQAGYRQWAANTFGVKGGEVATHGLLRLLGVDFASRLSQSSMWTFGSPASRKPNDLMASAATMFSGALGSTSMEFVKGVQKLAEGAKNYSAGATSLGNENMIEAGKNLAMFRMFTDIADAARKMSPGGMRTQGGALMREPYGPFEAAAKAVGFTPAREAESSEARRAKQTATQRLNASRKSWLDMWTQAQPAERTMMWPRIQQWNESQPAGGKVTREELEKALTARRKRESAPASQLGLPKDRRSKSFDDIPRAYNL